MSQTRFEKSIAERNRHDSQFEQTAMRRAYQEWRNSRRPIGKSWWDGWAWDVIDQSEWPAFIAGWQARP